MMQKHNVKLLIIVFALLTLACQTVMGGLSPEPTADVLPTWTPTPWEVSPTLEPSDGFQVTVENQTPYEICYVFISDSDDEYWGDDVLDASETILPGGSFVFDVSAGIHDLLIQDCDAVAIGTAWALDEDVTLTFGGEGTVPLRVVNESPAFVCRLALMHPASPPVIGETGLGIGEVLDPFGGERIFFVEPGLYNIVAESCDTGETYTVSALDIDVEPEWTIPEDALMSDAGDGEPFVVRVENLTPYDVCFVHISPTLSESWGADWLDEEEVIVPGGEHVFDVPGGVYDIAVFDCSDAVVATAWEVSEDVTLTPGDSGPVALHVVNESSQDICYLYIAPTSEEMWGDDRMGDMELIPAVEGIRAFYLEPDTYDVLVEDCDGEEMASEYEIELTEDYVWTISE